MPYVTCPTCGEKGKIPAHLVGVRIKCRKCNNSFLVTPPTAKAEAAATSVLEDPGPRPAVAARTRRDGIEVDGLDDSAWSVTPTAAAEHDGDHGPEHEHDESTPAFTASHSEGHPVKQYKILTQKDPFFEGSKFDLSRLEEAINHYARQGWSVRSMATPHLTGFSGGPREELVVLLER